MDSLSNLSFYKILNLNDEKLMFDRNALLSNKLTFNQQKILEIIIICDESIF